METINITGKIECILCDKGSKSEGMRCFLTDETGKQYKLYRQDILPQYDDLLLRYNGKTANISGIIEKENGSIRVDGINETLPENPENTDHNIQ